MDLLGISSLSLVVFILGTVIGWLIARSRFTKRIAELNTNLVLERRVNKQLSERLRFDNVPNLVQAPHLSTPAEPTCEPMVSSG